jgi:hypothetical protein
MNLIKVMERFPDQKACIAHLEKIRWGNEPRCPHCNSKHVGWRNAIINHKEQFVKASEIAVKDAELSVLVDELYQIKDALISEINEERKFVLRNLPTEPISKSTGGAD